MTTQTDPRIITVPEFSFVEAAAYHRLAQARQAEIIANGIYAAWQAVARVAGGAFRAARSQLERRRAYEELQAMDDRLLADMGLARSDLLLVISGRLRREPASGHANENIGAAANANRPRSAA